MNEKICLELGVALWIIHVLIQGGLANAAFPSGYLFTPRDIQPMPKGLLFGRATSALANYVENFAPFVALDLGLMVSGHGGGYGARFGSLRAQSIFRSTCSA